MSTMMVMASALSTTSLSPTARTLPPSAITLTMPLNLTPPSPFLSKRASPVMSIWLARAVTSEWRNMRIDTVALRA